MRAAQGGSDITICRAAGARGRACVGMGAVGAPREAHPCLLLAGLASLWRPGIWRSIGALIVTFIMPTWANHAEHGAKESFLHSAHDLGSVQ